jgi:hypothetical protein
LYVRSAQCLGALFVQRVTTATVLVKLHNMAAAIELEMAAA